MSGAAGIVLAALAAVHVTQGTSGVGFLDLLGMDDEAARVLAASRLPRLLAGVLVGFALGVAGAAFQSLARNPLASPDTLAVNAGAHLAVVVAAAAGISLPVLPSGGLAFVGGLGAAGLVMLLSAGGGGGPARLVLAGSAVALALSALTTLVMILFEQSTTGLFAWGSGTLVQSDLRGVTQVGPVVAACFAVLLVLGRRLDVLGLGDDSAAVMGVPVRRVRLQVTLLAVLLSAAAVTVAGPIGFAGLCAPVIVRLAGRAAGLAAVHRHRVLLPLSGVAGAGIVLAADVVLRAVMGGQAGVDIPTGVVTTLAGAVVLVVLARKWTDAGGNSRGAGYVAVVRSRRFFVSVVVVCGVALCAAVFAGMLLGDTMLLAGDLWNWLHGETGRALTYVLDQRYPRVLAAVLSGAALAVAGTVVQAVCRNALAEPGLLGISAGAGAGAVTMLTLVPLAGIGLMSGAAGLGALVAFGVVYGLARGVRRSVSLSSDRLVLVGVGVSAGCAALTTFIIAATDPWNTAKALTWLSGSTYGRTAEQVLPVALALLLVAPLAFAGRRELDLLALDDDTPRVLGVPLDRVRLVALLGAALLTSTAVSAAGVVGFVGLVAPHAARMLAGSSHARVLPVAALLGAILVSVADTFGRTVIAPAQVPAGLVTAMIGTPYFAWLLWRSRVAARGARVRRGRRFVVPGSGSGSGSRSGSRSVEGKA